MNTVLKYPIFYKLYILFLLLILIRCDITDYPDVPIVRLPPSTPIIIAPANKEFDVVLNPEIEWNPSFDAESYNIQISRSSVFEIIDNDQNEINNTSFSSNEFFNNTKYYLRIKAVNIVGSSNWSDTIEFTTIDTTTDIITFKKTFDENENDEANYVVQTSDGGYAIAGNTGNSSLNYKAWIIKTDNKGNLLWEKKYSGMGNGEVYSIQETYDNGFILGGQTYKGAYHFAWLLKLDNNGNEEWSKTFGGDYSDLAYCAQETQDSGFVLGGSTEEFGIISMWLIKTDKEGNYEWSNVYSGSNGSIYVVRCTADGGYILAGISDYTATLIKTDKSGNQMWLKKYDFDGLSIITSVEQTDDDGYILSVNSGQNSTYAILIKIDKDGNQIWLKDFYIGEGSGGEKFGYSVSSVKQYNGDVFIATGSSISRTVSDYIDLWIVKIDNQANIIWEKFYSINVHNNGKCLSITNDGGFIITGTTGIPSSIFEDGYDDIWLIKTNMNGNIFINNNN